MNTYSFLLLWQALLTGSAFWIRPAGWLWCLLCALLVIVVEWLISAFAQKKGLQAFSTPFKGTKYRQDSTLLMMQTAFTSVLMVVLLAAFSMNGSWNLFWIDLIGSAVFGILIAVTRRKDRG